MSLICIVLNYNDALTTKRFVESVKDIKSITHILIVDNCSTDNSLSILMPLKDNNIEVVKTPKNGGYGYGNNYGIRYSVNNYKTTNILISNPDVIIEEESVVAMNDYLIDNLDCCVCSCLMKDINGEPSKISAWKIPTIKQVILSSSIVLNKIFHNNMYYSSTYLLNKSQCEVDCVSGSLLMVDAKKMIQYGMYDEDFFLYYEENILGFKLKQNNLRTVILSDYSFIHMHGISIKKNFKSINSRLKLLKNSEFLFLEKYLGINKIEKVLAKFIFSIRLFELSFFDFWKKYRKIIIK